MASQVPGVEARPAEATAAFLLIHGFCAAPDEVRTLADYLSARGIASFSVQIAGHNTTPEDLRDTTWQDWYNSVVRGLHVVRSWDYERIFVAGFSLGGALAVMLAPREDDIEGLVLIAPALNLFGVLPRLVPILKHFMEFRDIDVEKAQEVYEVKRTKYDREPVSAYHELLKLQKMARESLGAITVPAVIIQGKEDKTISPKNGQIAYDGIASETKVLHIIDEAEHVIPCHHTRHEAYQLIGEFLEKQFGI
ncbi:alpha/beta fold hydrolase [Candidatus Thorarchaeota archaeon]|nr:MAG: alpha/beta fold hydrolase [Candidatus Thorarchaeota archaeon]